MFRQKRAVGKSLLVVAVLIIILASVFFYYDTNLTKTTSSDRSSVQDLQKVIATLQSRNSQLESQLAAGSNSQGSTTVFGLDPVQIYDSANHGVVTIQGVQIVPVNSIFGVQNSVQTILGSGFVISYLNSFYIVTNFHVVDGIVNATVTFWDGNSYSAKVIGTDAYSDLAVVSVSAPSSEFSPLEIAPSSSLRVGQPVVAIGNPFGLSGSETFGIISQLGRTLQEQTTNFAIADIIQFSAPINPGNSGGPLLNSQGMVIGMTTAVVGGSQGVGFAVPSNTIQRELTPLISTGKYTLHPYMGINGVDMNLRLAQAMNVNVTYGVLIQSVFQGSPAEKAGLKGGDRTIQIGGQQYGLGGDIIVSINGTRIVSQDALSTYLEEHAGAGQTIQVGIVRSGGPATVMLTLGERPAPQG